MQVSRAQHHYSQTPERTTESSAEAVLLSTTRSGTSTEPQPSALILQSQSSLHDASPIAFVDDSDFPVQAWVKNLSSSDLQNLREALAQPPEALSPEQQSLLAALDIGALDTETRAQLSETLLLETTLQALRGGNYKSSSITLSLINQLQKLAQEPDLTAERYHSAFPAPFIQVTGLQQLRDPALIPLLPRLAEQAETLKQPLQPVAVGTSNSSLAIHELRRSSEALLAQNARFSGAMSEKLEQALTGVQEQVQSAREQRESLDLERAGLDMNQGLLQRRLQDIEAALAQPDMETHEQAVLELDQMRYQQELERIQAKMTDLNMRIEQLDLSLQSTRETYSQSQNVIEAAQRAENFYALSQEQRQGLESNSALSALDTIMEKHAGGLREHVKQLLTGEQAQSELNLDAGLNYSLTQILNPDNAGELRTLSGLLAGDMATLSADEKETLRRFGLHAQGDQLINLANRSPINAEQLNALQQASTALAPTPSTGPESPSVSSLAHREILSTVGANLLRLETSRGRVEDYAARLDTATHNLEQTNARIEALMQEAQELTQTANDFEARLSQATEIVEHLRSLRDQRELKDYLRQLAATGQLAELQDEISDFLGLDIEVEGNEVKFFYNGHKMKPEGFVRLLEVRLRLKNIELERMQGEIADKHSEIASEREQLKHDEAELLQTRDEAQLAIQDYRAELSHSQSDLQSLLALRNDPQRWNQMPPEQQEAVQEMISRLQAEQARAPELLHRMGRAFERAEQALERAQQNRALADILLAQLSDLLLKLNELGDRLLQLRSVPEGDLEGPKQELAVELLRDLPRPEASEQAFSDWLEELRASYAQNDRLVTAEQNQSEIERSFQRQQLALRQQALKHHLEQIEALDTRSHERIQTLLQESLQSRPRA